ncbi:amino acid adenylation domain-containing protein [Actinoplanes sp. Pm04-4]|uniref:Amino acid adenylation domain-containing protein n=1 Tax=Paractinoplanes pyxinae TaxID=2997416 RepID=A0ABT4BC41_9ACTN|nr:amino acid adenylation domain-containing protein [Actinoplanes pyxinae]MCY1144094.1 amino acid adenylation domain-containing protein [Actinoplanes pyxinae]
MPELEGSELIHEAVGRQALRRPEATAVFFRGSRVTYGTLDAAAEAYADMLAGAGVGPSSTVAVILPRGPQLIAVLLAVLKCGAAYAAIDRRWPQARIEQVTRLIAAGTVVSGSPTDATGHWLTLDEPLEQVAARARPRPRVRIDGAHPATVFFTSGSTGNPKAVVSPHRATTRLFTPGGFADFGPGHTMLQAAPCSWDAFSLEVWGPLISGGTCAVAEQDHLLPGILADLIRTTEVDTAWLTTSLFNLLVDEDDPGKSCFAGLRQVLTGGERLSPAHVASLLARHPDVDLINGYGPVESCVFATTHKISAMDCARDTGIPLGTPVPQTTVLVLDGERVLPRDSLGEICIAGAGLAIGYAGDPDATDAAFATVQLDGVPTRVYRTGDFGLIDSDGLLHFRGRRDLQIKIAGYRIEPEEIEAVARQLPGVRDVAVVATAAQDGESARLLLLYTTAAGDAPRPHAVRRALVAVLPAYLVPHVVRQMTTLPTTATGKLDRQALLASC